MTVQVKFTSLGKAEIGSLNFPTLEALSIYLLAQYLYDQTLEDPKDQAITVSFKDKTGKFVQRSYPNILAFILYSFSVASYNFERGVTVKP